MPAFLLHVIPAPTQFVGLIALIAVSACFVALGAFVAGRDRRPEADLLHGWAIVSAVFTIAGIAGLSAFTPLVAALGVLAIAGGIAVVRRDGRLGAPGALRILILATPLILLVAAMIPTQWDELTHWLPNARYLFEHDSFPREGLPKSPSNFPAYPYGVPLVIYLASRLTGSFVANAAAIFNLLLYLSFGLFVVRLIAATAPSTRDEPLTPGAIGRVRIGWGLAAFAGLVVTALNPTYVTRLVFSAYADAPTAIAIGFAGVLAWLMLNALSEGDETAARSFAWQVALALTAALSLKQVNLVFLIALAIACGLIALRDPGIRWKPLLRLSLYALALPIATYVLWRLYVGLHVAGGEFSFRPYAGWFIEDIPAILGSMALVASKKGGYFGIMLVATAIAVRAAWRPRTAFDRLAVLTGTLFVTYNGFLFFTYLAAFGSWEATRAASYWRYNTHLGGICLVFAAYSLALLWRRLVTRPVPRAAAALAMLLVVALPFAMGAKLRFDSHPRYGYAYDVAGDIAARLSASDRLMLVDPWDHGQYLVIMRYEMHNSASIVGEISAWSRPDAKKIRDSVSERRPTHVWLYGSSPATEGAFDVPLPPGASYLLARGSKGWSIVARWPHPAGTRN